MCGIAGVYLKNTEAGTDEGMNAFADALMCEIEPRGRHATGFVSIGWDKSVRIEKAAVPASEFIKTRERFQDGVQAVLLHTRFWTKGKPEESGNNHPVIYGSCFAIHNGSINNDDKLFESENLPRNHEVDSEIIPALLDKHGLGSPDTIREALEKFQGAMAIAAIDPIKNPTRLVLAKGSSSPMYVFENKNVIMWASTFQAIKDAWGKVIGTPPQSNKIKFVSEGTFFIADDYGELGKYEFTVPKAPARNYSYQGGSENGRGTGWGRSRRPEQKKPWDSQGPFAERRDFDRMMNEYRQSEETRLARLWRKRSSYDDKTDFQDVTGAISWHNCHTCSSSVLGEDTIPHLKYGKICIDCAAIISKQYQDNAAASRDLRSSDYPIPELSEVDRKNLESWAQLEARAHRHTLNEVSDLTGYSIQALDYLIFRTATVGSDFGTAMIGAKVAIRRLYEKCLENVYTEHSDELMAETDAAANMTVEEAQQLVEDLYYPWFAYANERVGEFTRIMYVCEDHGEQFPYGDCCHTCFNSDTDFNSDYAVASAMGSCGIHPGDENAEGEHEECGVEAFKSDKPASVTTLNKCETCGTWVNGPCALCAARAEKTPEPKELTETRALTQSEVKSCSCKAGTSKSRKCRKKLKFILNNPVIGRKGYCNHHYNKCANDRCNKDANFTCLSGMRVCHAHARSRQGIADNASTELVIEEVK